jgi:histidinol dehydrogenase
MRVITLDGGRRLTPQDLERAGALPREVMEAAEAIVDDVRARGDAALREYCLRFDGACPDDFRVPDAWLREATKRVDPLFLEALTLARDQIRDFHEREAEQSWFTTRPDGTVLGVKVTPVESAALYVPGGRAQYPSTVLMDALPAKVAGVERVIMVTPPQKDGSISPYTLAAAALAGVDEVYAVGGAQAIAAVAYGTESIPRVSKVVGPGNAYVAAAKRYVSGDVGIDMVAGPSEVCVLADASADPAVVAADLMAQAEHDPMATCYLVTCDAELPQAVMSCVERLVASSPREQITAASLEHGQIVVCEDLETALAAVDTIAPEHLELHCEDAWALMAKVHNAGAIFVGPWSSEPLGDYVAGPNHTLPTGGTAAFSNPLGVYDFQKRSSVIAYSPEGVLKDVPAVQALAQAEGLWAHALSAGMRLDLARQGRERYENVAAACENASSIAWPVLLREPAAAGASGTSDVARPAVPGVEGR